MIQTGRILACLAVAWTLWGAAPTQAHEKHAGHESVRTTRMARGDTLEIPEPPTLGTAVGTKAAEPSFEMPPMTEAVMHHLHNKLVHFPIVLALLGFLTLFLSRGRPELFGLGRALAWAAALSAGGGVWAGLAQASDFRGEPKGWLVLVHRNWGIATAAALVLTALLTLWRPTRRYAWMSALLAAILVSVAGYLGGLVSHG